MEMLLGCLDPSVCLRDDENMLTSVAGTEVQSLMKKSQEGGREREGGDLLSDIPH